MCKLFNDVDDINDNDNINNNNDNSDDNSYISNSVSPTNTAKRQRDEIAQNMLS